MADRILEAYASRAQSDAFSESDQPSAFSDTVSAAFALTRREEISSSAIQAWGKKVDQRAKKIQELGGDYELARRYGMTPLVTVRQFRQWEKDGSLYANPIYQAERRGAMGDAYQYVREFERRYPGVVPDDEALLDEVKAEYAQLRTEDQAVIDRGGGFAAFLGTTGGVMTDPLVLATLPFGGTGAGSRSVLGTIGKTAATEGAVALATEIPIQAQVYAFKREIESPWSFKDSAVNVLAAGVGGAALGGTIAGGVEGTRAVLRSYREGKAAGRIVPTEETEAAAAQLEDALAVEQANPFPEAGPLGEDLHLSALEQAREQVENHQAVDVAETVSIAEPQGGVGQVITRSQDPAQLVDIDPAAVQVDARTFQFKTGGDAEGVTSALRDVQRFDRRLAGVALIWQRADGQQFIADGHQRLALARRAIQAGQDPAEVRLNGFVLREEDGISAVDARRIAAIKNMAEGSGSPLDAAKILRDLGAAGEAALPPLPPRSALVRQARGLSQLGEEEFLQVVNGVIDERFGAIVGNATAEPKLQGAMIQVLKRAQPANETQARSIVDQVRAQGLETRTTEDLFGEVTFAESLYLERAKVLDEALRLMRQDRAVFGGLVSNQDRITAGAGNRLDTEGNLARQQEAADVAAQISVRANARGALSDALQAAARGLGEGQSVAAAAKAFLKAARREILSGDRGRKPAGKAGRKRKTAGAAPEVGQPLALQGLSGPERRAALQAFKAKQAGQSVEDLYQVAEQHQAALRAVADEVAAQFGDDVRVLDPGVKKRAGTEEKITRKGYKDAGELTDVIRLGFITRTPQQAAQILERLGQRFELLDEGVTVTGLGYLDHKALVRFPDGRIAEVQLWDEALAAAKQGDGHALYEQARGMTPEQAATPEGQALTQQIEEGSRQLYAAAIARASPEWRQVAMQALPEDMRARVQAALESGAAEGGGAAAGRGGASGNVSRNTARDSSLPDSSTSTGTTRVQDSAPSGTNQASGSRTTAGRPSQLKNRSAIDAPPRSIIQRVGDPHSAQPEASRTGTVPDDDYAAVMSRFAGLQEDLGEQLRVSSVVDGEPVDRSAAAVLEELDTLEESLERIRVCATPARSQA